jgi:hypothetical protein
VAIVEQRAIAKAIPSSAVPAESSGCARLK